MTDESTTLEENRVNQREMSAKYLAFSLGKDQYAIPLLQVKEVIAVTEIKPIPCCPSYFKGIINLRGQIIPIFDLRLKLKYDNSEIAGETSIIILELDNLCLGMIVDAINSVLALTKDNISPSPEIEASVNAEFITGVAKDDGHLSLLLDINSVLNVDDMQMLKMQKQKKAA